MPAKSALPSAAPRSALHYRPIMEPDGTQIPQKPRTSVLANKQQKSTNPPVKPTTVVKSDTSVKSNPPPAPNPPIKLEPPLKLVEEKPKVEINLQRHVKNKLIWLVVCSMLIGMALVTLGQFALSWGSSTYDNLRYGNPRTYQMDAFVGHESGTTPSHFIALNFKGRVEVIEFPGGDVTHSRVFVGPQLFGTNADLVPITIQFPNPNHSKTPDMQVDFQNTHITFHNVHGTFQP